MTATVFGKTMGAFALIGLPIAALVFPMSTKAGDFPASVSAIGLPAIAATADAKGNVAKTTFQANQKHNLALSRAIVRATIESLQRTSGLVPKVIFTKARNVGFGLFPLFKNIPEFNRLKELATALRGAYQ